MQTAYAAIWEKMSSVLRIRQCLFATTAAFQKTRFPDRGLPRSPCAARLSNRCQRIPTGSTWKRLLRIAAHSPNTASVNRKSLFSLLQTIQQFFSFLSS